MNKSGREAILHFDVFCANNSHIFRADVLHPQNSRDLSLRSANSVRSVGPNPPVSLPQAQSQRPPRRGHKKEERSAEAPPPPSASTTRPVRPPFPEAGVQPHVFPDGRDAPASGSADWTPSAARRPPRRTFSCTTLNVRQRSFPTSSGRRGTRRLGRFHAALQVLRKAQRERLSGEVETLRRHRARVRSMRSTAAAKTSKRSLI